MKNFKRIVFQLIAPELEGKGFLPGPHPQPVLIRTLESGVHHVIAFDRFFHVPKFDVMVFPTHPQLFTDPNAEVPEIAVPTGDNCRLRIGAGLATTGSTFSSASEAALKCSISEAVLPGLMTIAVPYLDGFQNLSDILLVLNDSARYLYERNIST